MLQFPEPEASRAPTKNITIARSISAIFILVVLAISPNQVYAAYGDESIDYFNWETIASDNASNVWINTEGDFTYIENYDDTAVIIGYEGSERDIIIPPFLGGRPVSAVGGAPFSGYTPGVFEDNQSIDSVTIPEGVHSLAYNTFWNSSIKTINLPSTYIEFDSHIFIGCNQLTEIRISDNNPILRSIDGNVYSKDASMLYQYAYGKPDTTFTIPSTVTTIDDYVFYYTTCLQTLNIPDSVTSAGRLTSQSIKTIYIGKNFELLDADDVNWRSYFGECLENIHVSPGHPYLSSLDGVLYNKDFTEIITYPNGRSNKSFIAPETVTSVRSSAFQYCRGALDEVVFPSKIEYLGYGSFDQINNGVRYGHIERIVFKNGVNEAVADYARIWVPVTVLIGDSSVQKLADASEKDYLNPDISLNSLFIADQTFSGIPLTPDVQLQNGNSVLRRDIDYIVAYKNNVMPGLATATITGIGEFHGTKNITFQILESSGSWVQDSNGWWYRQADGSYPANKWAQIEGSWYYFNKSGYMQTSWQQIGGKWYYLGTNGVMTTGWQKVGGVWYYFNDSGIMQTGWQQIDKSWYYFNGSGAMQTGWLQTGGKWYYLKSSGVMATGWVSVGGTWYHMNTTGVMQTGWQHIDGNWYYLKSSGGMAIGWYQVGSMWYYSNSSGVMQTNRWVGNYWVGESGAMATSTMVDSGKYRVDANGHWIK